MTDKALTKQQLEDLVIESDAGARQPRNKAMAFVLLATAFAWSLFQLWISSDLPFKTGFLVLNGTESRSIHLMFATVLAFLAYPAFKSSPRYHIPIIDIVLALVGGYCAAYLFIEYEAIADRSGLPTTWDIVVALTGIVLLLEATRRALGPPLVIIASLFLLYTYFGSSPFVPELIRHGGQSLTKIASHQWLTPEGVFGIALGVSTDFVFLFVLFGALLERAGAGNYFIKLAFSMLGHFRGGPAKAAVLSSGMTGLISGSSIANTVTTGTFTIPLMKRVGFVGEKAGAVEVASSVNGQIMPPVMGAAAFLMAEYVNLPYVEVIKHAFLPALISYIALLYMVHLEALKGGMQALEKPVIRTFKQKVFSTGIIISSLILLSGAVYYGIGWIKELSPENAIYYVVAALFVAYAALIRYAAKLPDLEVDDPNAPVVALPETGPTVKTGLHYLLPIVVLIWCLMVERFSPGYSAFWATLFMLFILATQRPLKAFFRNTSNMMSEVKEGGKDIVEGMIMGARNMIGIGVATAAAGIIVGTVSLTGVGQVLTEVVEVLSGGSLILILLFTALICIVLGMGLPTTANYIVVASLMTQVVEQLGIANGLYVPLIAIHMFVFYFGIMADVTPPVGLASFAAAAISGADPIKTGIQAFVYSIRTAVLPFFFIFNTELLMIGVDSAGEVAFIFLYSTIAILVLSAATQGYFLVRSTFYESIMLVLVSVTLFVPQLWNNMVFPKYHKGDYQNLIEEMDQVAEGEMVRIQARGEDQFGEIINVTSYIPIQGSGAESLDAYGLLEIDQTSSGDKIYEPGFDTMAFRTGIEFDFVITGLDLPNEQQNPRWFYIPAMILLAFVIMLQTARKRREEALARIKK